MTQEVHIQSNFPLIILTVVVLCGIILAYLEFKKINMKVDKLIQKLNETQNKTQDSKTNENQMNYLHQSYNQHPQQQTMYYPTNHNHYEKYENNHNSMDDNKDDRSDRSNDSDDRSDDRSDDSDDRSDDRSDDSDDRSDHRSDYSDDRSDHRSDYSDDHPQDLNDNVTQDDSNIISRTKSEEDILLSGEIVPDKEDIEEMNGNVDLQNLSVNQLKEVCKQMDLPYSGNKTKLVQRILENK